MTTQQMRRRQPSTGQKKKDKHTGRSTFCFLYIEINTMHKFSCMHNVVYVHVKQMVVIMHTICEGL